MASWGKRMRGAILQRRARSEKLIAFVRLQGQDLSKKDWDDQLNGRPNFFLGHNNILLRYAGFPVLVAPEHRPIDVSINKIG